jgi:hypothetical protein
LFQPSWFRGAPWQDQEGFRSRSAITYVEKITTPKDWAAIIHSSPGRCFCKRSYVVQRSARWTKRLQFGEPARYSQFTQRERILW